jgi:signal recognition particle GTPase
MTTNRPYYDRLSVSCHERVLAFLSRVLPLTDRSFIRMHAHAAKQKGMDVVLIDTAGRMQDNRRLMQALAKVPTLPWT